MENLKKIAKKGIAVYKQKKFIADIKKQTTKKIVIGASTTNFDGWLSTDKDVLDVTNQKNWAKYFKKSSIDNLLAEHMFEHLTYNQTRTALQLCKKYLKKGGCLRIAVPDANHPSRYVYNLTKPGGIDPGADDHKIFFDIEIVKRLAAEFNFELKLLEYFDEKGFFFQQKFNFNNGYISRCSKNYKGRFTNSNEELQKLHDSLPPENLKQFKQLNITYTSLLFDLIKK